MTLVPLRSLLEKLGVQVKWDQAIRTVSGSNEGPSFSLKIGSTMRNCSQEKLSSWIGSGGDLK
ncbi:stalk domain-containing protein [Paenibacillus taichungensis]|uniref:stalk domain-containing protein n=1 Tax=Paenibacillus taichungensis TaxID=484184 RepID=UPI0039A4CF55